LFGLAQIIREANFHSQVSLLKYETPTFLSLPPAAAEYDELHFFHALESFELGAVSVLTHPQDTLTLFRSLWSVIP